MTTAIIILVVVVLAAGAYFAFARKPAQLPPGEQPKAQLPPKKDTSPLGPQQRAPEAKPAAQEKKPSAKPAPVEEEIAEPISIMPGPPDEEEVRPAKRDVSALRKGLAASRGGFIARLRALVSGKKEIDPAILEQMEEVMLSSDVGVQTTQAILGRLRERLDRSELTDENAVWSALRAEATDILKVGTHGPIKRAGKPTVVLMVGVNGVGK